MKRIDSESLRTIQEDESSPTRRLLDSSHTEEKSVGIDGIVSIHTACPLTEGRGIVCREEDATPKQESHLHYYASYAIIFIHICSFIAFICLFGIDPISANPLIGPPVKIIEEYGAKNPVKVRDEHEYWRIVTAMFVNLGFLDMFFSVIMLYNFGRCLERKWGCTKWLSIYLISGIGGNLYSSYTQQIASSVGNGGCILGLLGALHADFVMDILFYPYEHGCNTKTLMHDEAYSTCAMTVIGLLIGIVSVIFTEHLYAVNDEDYDINQYKSGNFESVVAGDDGLNSMRKDWSVLYGGMLTGTICAYIWNLFTIKPPFKVKADVIDTELPLTRIELFFRLIVLVMPLLVLQLIFTMQ